jgi:hypothetical protein
MQEVELNALIQEGQLSRQSAPPPMVQPEAAAPAVIEAPAVMEKIEGPDINLVIKHDKDGFIIEKGDRRIRLPLSTGITVLKRILDRVGQSESEVMLSVEQTEAAVIITGDINIHLPLDSGITELNRILQRLDAVEPEVSENPESKDGA